MQVQVSQADLLMKIGLLVVENDALKRANTHHAEGESQAKAAVVKAEEEVQRLRIKCGEETPT
jgi:hypothetical protein